MSSALKVMAEQNKEQNAIDIRLVVNKGVLLDNIKVGNPVAYDLSLLIAKLESLKLQFIKLFDETTKTF